MSQSIRETHVLDRFCNRCLHLLKHWPKLIGPDLEGHTVVGPCYVSDIERCGAHELQILHFSADAASRLAGNLATMGGSAEASAAPSKNLNDNLEMGWRGKHTMAESSRHNLNQIVCMDDSHHRVLV